MTTTGKRKREYGTKRICREHFWVVRSAEKRTGKYSSKKVVGFCACNEWGGPRGSDVEPRRFDHWKARHHCPDVRVEKQAWNEEKTSDWVPGAGIVH